MSPSASAHGLPHSNTSHAASSNRRFRMILAASIRTAARFCGRCRRPGGERLAGRGDGRFGVLDFGQRDLPHDPRAVARVDRIQPPALGVNLLPADQEGIRSPELQSHRLDRLPHRLAVLGPGEIHRRLVPKRRNVQTLARAAEASLLGRRFSVSIAPTSSGSRSSSSTGALSARLAFRNDSFEVFSSSRRTR